MRHAMARRGAEVLERLCLIDKEREDGRLASAPSPGWPRAPPWKRPRYGTSRNRPIFPGYYPDWDGL